MNLPRILTEEATQSTVQVCVRYCELAEEPLCRQSDVSTSVQRDRPPTGVSQTYNEVAQARGAGVKPMSLCQYRHSHHR